MPKLFSFRYFSYSGNFLDDFVSNLNPNLTRPIFLNFLVDKLEEALYTDSAGCFLVKLD